MHSKCISTRQISEQIDNIYGFEVSEGFISDITNKFLPETEEWKQSPLSTIYPAVFIDAIHFSVRDNNVIKKFAAYVILKINEDKQSENKLEMQEFCPHFLILLYQK